MWDIATSRVQIGKHFHANMGPIIEPGPLEKLVRNAKPERLDEVERRMRGGAGPCYIACVLRYFRLIKKDGQAEAVGRITGRPAVRAGR